MSKRIDAIRKQKKIHRNDIDRDGNLGIFDDDTLSSRWSLATFSFNASENRPISNGLQSFFTRAFCFNSLNEFMINFIFQFKFFISFNLSIEICFTKRTKEEQFKIKK